MNKKVFAYPYIVWMGIFIIVPMAMVVVCAFTADFSSSDFTFTLANFDRLINSELNYVEVFVRSIKLALICTAICLAIGYPVSYIIADRKMKLPSLLIIMFIMPMWMNFLLRTYAIRHILNTVPFLSGLMATEGGVVLGMVYNYLPFMILPVYSALTKMDPSLTEAAGSFPCWGVQARGASVVGAWNCFRDYYGIYARYFDFCNFLYAGRRNGAYDRRQDRISVPARHIQFWLGYIFCADGYHSALHAYYELF